MRRILGWLFSLVTVPLRAVGRFLLSLVTVPVGAIRRRLARAASPAPSEDGNGGSGSSDESSSLIVRPASDVIPPGSPDDGNGEGGDSSNGSESEGNRVRIHHRDWLFHWLFTIPLFVGIVFAAIGGFAVANAATLFVIVPGNALILWSAFIARFGVSRVAGDIVAYRQFLRGPQYFENCLVVDLRFIRGLIKFVKFPVGVKSAQLTFTTQIKQQDASDLQKEIVTIFFELRRDRPDLIMQNYLDEFARSESDGYAEVKRQVLAMVEAFADRVLQGFEMEDLLTDVAKPSDALRDELREPLETLAVQLRAVSIDDTQDIGEDGYVAQRAARIRAQLARERRMAQADANREATLREQDAQMDILKKQREVIKRQLANERENVKVGIADLRARIELYDKIGPTRSAALELLKRFEDLPTDQIVPFVAQIAEALKSAGLRPEGSLLLAGDSSQALNATALGSLAALFEKLMAALGKSAA